jgi:hypothetical protein
MLEKVTLICTPSQISRRAQDGGDEKETGFETSQRCAQAKMKAGGAEKINSKGWPGSVAPPPRGDSHVRTERQNPTQDEPSEDFVIRHTDSLARRAGRSTERAGCSRDRSGGQDISRWSAASPTNVAAMENLVPLSTQLLCCLPRRIPSIAFCLFFSF